jgi:hypothetical protein
MSALEGQLLERALRGSDYLSSAYDSDIDIAGPKQFLITTGAKKCSIVIRIKGPAAALAALNKTVVIGTGGGFSVGTALTKVARDQANTLSPLVTVGEDYVVGTGGGASAGSAIVTEYHFPNIETVIKFKLAASSRYGLIFTTIADNNSASFTFEIDEV